VISNGYLVALPDGAQGGTMMSGCAIVSTGVVLYQRNIGAWVYGSAAGDVLVITPAMAYVLLGGTTSETTVNSGGAENVYSNATVSLSTVKSGGAEFVFSGGTAGVQAVTLRSRSNRPLQGTRPRARLR